MSVEEARLRMISRMLNLDASDEGKWVTLKHSHVLIKNGVVQSGPLKGKEFPNAKSIEPTKSVITKTTSKRAKEVINSIYDGILTHEGKQGDKKYLSELKASIQGANDKEKLANLIKKVDTEYSKGVKPRIYHGITKEEIDAYRTGADSFNSHEPSVYKNYEPITEEEKEKRRAASKARKEKMANSKKGLLTIGKKDKEKTDTIVDALCEMMDSYHNKTSDKLYKHYMYKAPWIDRHYLKVGDSIVYNSEIYTKVGEKDAKHFVAADGTLVGDGLYQKKDIKTGREIGNPISFDLIFFGSMEDKKTAVNKKTPFDSQKYFEEHPVEVYKDNGEAKKYSDVTKTGKLKPPMPQKEARKELATLCKQYWIFMGYDNLQRMLNAIGVTLVDDMMSTSDDVDAIKGIAKFYKYCTTYIPRHHDKNVEEFYEGIETPVLKKCIEYERKKHAKPKKKATA